MARRRNQAILKNQTLKNGGCIFLPPLNPPRGSGEMKKGVGGIIFLEMKRDKILIFFLALLLLALIILGVFAIGVYKVGWNGEITQKFSRIIPLPAATVNGKIISLSDYWQMLEIDKKFGGDSGKSIKSSNLLLEYLIENQIVVDLLKSHLQSLDFNEEDYYQYLTMKFKNNGQFPVFENSFKKFIVLQDLNKVKLKIWWHAQDTNSDSYKKARLAEQEIEKGVDFEYLSEIYSDDQETKYIGGDLGFMTEKELPPWFSKAVTNLEIGKSTGILNGPDGYYLLKVASVNENSDPSRKQIKQIYIKSDTFDKFFEIEKQKYRVLVFKNL